MSDKRVIKKNKYLVWEIFAIFGLILGIFTFVTAFSFPFLFHNLSILGILFSLLGKNSYKNYEKAIKFLSE